MQLRIHSPLIAALPLRNPSVFFFNAHFTNFHKSLGFSLRLPKFRGTHVPFCSENGVFEESVDTLLHGRPQKRQSEDLELLNKPSPKWVVNDDVESEQSQAKKAKEEEALAAFYKFFKAPEEEADSNDSNAPSIEEDTEKINVEYYEPKAGDLVVGVVVSGNENRLDVNVGADFLGTMLTKEVLPLYNKEMGNLLCDLKGEFLSPGKVGIVRNDEALHLVGRPSMGKPVVDIGTVIFAEVLGRTLGGRPLLSVRKLFRRIAWHRVRQIKLLNEPIEVKITEWNAGGLLTRLEGLRAFIPKVELLNRVNNVTELKENVGQRMRVQINSINEDTNHLILSEREAWETMHLKEGRLVNGTVVKFIEYGAIVRIGDSKRSGLLHIRNISKGKVTSISDILSEGEEVKVLVLKPVSEGKISLSIAELESEPGLFLTDKQRVFMEAETMAKKYRQKMSAVSEGSEELEAALPTEKLPFGNEETVFANWEWFTFEGESL